MESRDRVSSSNPRARHAMAVASGRKRARALLSTLLPMRSFIVLTVGHILEQVSHGAAEGAAKLVQRLQLHAARLVVVKREHGPVRQAGARREPFDSKASRAHLSAKPVADAHCLHATILQPVVVHMHPSDVIHHLTVARHMH